MDGFIEPGPLPASVLDRIAAAAPAYDRSGEFPRDSIEALREAGALSLTVPARLGGHGAGLSRVARVVRQAGAACASTALILVMQSIHQHRVAHGEGLSAALRDRLGRAAVEKGALLNALRVEPALGSPNRGGLPATVARPVPGGWRLSGRKIFSTGCYGLQWGLVWARTDEAAPRTGYFLVPMDAPGVSIEPSWDHLGLRASCSHDVILRDVMIGDENAGELRPNEGWRAMDPETQTWQAVLLGALYTGVATAARDWIVRFLQNRVPTGLGAPLATLPRMQEAIGEIEELLAANAGLISFAAQAADFAAPPAPLSMNLLKLTLTANAARAVERAVSLAGNPGISRNNPLERHWRDVQCARVHSPQADSVHVAAGRAALGV
jgi:alkylation response protein AidB-like acyl-CoA dehydrogenase